MKSRNEENDFLYLEHIKEALENILEFTEGFDEETFLNNKLVNHATIRDFEVAGEATKRLSNEFRIKNAHLPWQKLAAFRDVLIHGYANIDLWIVWDTVNNDLPTMLNGIKEIIKRSEE